MIVDDEFDDMFPGDEMYPVYKIEANSIEGAWEEMKKDYSDCESCDEETYSLMRGGLVYMLKESK
jgi:hypothetical protein